MENTRLSKGQGIEVELTLTGHTFRGLVRFANEHFICIDEGGGVSAHIKYDYNSNSWHMGKGVVTFREVTI